MALSQSNQDAPFPYEAMEAQKKRGQLIKAHGPIGIHSRALVGPAHVPPLFLLEVRAQS